MQASGPGLGAAVLQVIRGSAMTILGNLLGVSWLSTRELGVQITRMSAIQATKQQSAGQSRWAVPFYRGKLDRVDARLDRLNEELRLKQFEAEQHARNAWIAYVASRRYCLNPSDHNTASRRPPDRGAGS